MTSFYREYIRHAKYVGHGINDPLFSELMRGERGDWVREASDIEARERANVQIKLQDSILWLVQILCYLVDMVGCFTSKEYKTGIYERSMPQSFKEKYDNKGRGTKPKETRSKSIKDLHNSPVLKDKRLFD